MNNSYDKEKAGQELERMAIERVANPHIVLHASCITDTTSWMSRYTAVPCGPAWVLASIGTSKEMTEEVVVTFQGIICKMELPPFTEKISSTSSHVKYLRQGVTITGLNTATFQRVSENINAIHHFFARFIGKDSLQPLTVVSHFEEYLSIETSNRYFTPRRAGTIGATEIPFSPHVDPHGYLARGAGSKFFHSEDNEVRYYEKITEDRDAGYKFIEAKPITFRTGDIVEVQVSFALLPLRDKKYKLSLILRSLTLFDSTYSQRLHFDEFVKQTAPQKSVMLKRRVGYVEEEIGTTRAKLAKMDIDGEEVVVTTENIDASSSSSLN